jgi:hypothetical protein
MKKLVLSIIFFFVTTYMFSQVPPQAISYQAVIRNSNGNAYGDKDVMIKVSILESSTTGTVIYSEEHSIITDKWGMVSLEVGNGTPVSGTFADIDWGSNSFFCKTEVDLLNGQGYEDVGISQFISVPYALYSGRAGTVDVVDYNQIINVPVLFSGDYNDLTNTPDFTGWDTDVSDDFSGDYNSLTNLPTLFSGNYNDLSNLPTLFSGNYNDLINLPDFTGWDTNEGDDFSGNYNDLTNLPTLFDGDYYSLTNLPTLFDGTWTSLTGKPTFATVATTGNYSDLSNLPTLFSGNYNDLTNLPDFTGWDTNESNDFSGDYNDLINTPNIDGSETKINPGTNVTITGTGTSSDPYVINSTSGTSGISIGDDYGGGKVVYLDETGLHGLIAILRGGISQSLNSSLDYITDSNGIGGGYNNTISWVINIPTYETYPRLAFQYEEIQNGITYGGWYMPCEFELKKIYENKAILGITDGIFLSSSVVNQNAVYAVDFSNGSTIVLTTTASGNQIYVRIF